MITNVSFYANAAVGNGGGMHNVRSPAVIVNSVLWGNTAAAGAQVGNAQGTATISYSLIENCGGSGAGWDGALGTDGGNNIDANPLFGFDVEHFMEFNAILEEEHPEWYSLKDLRLNVFAGVDVLGVDTQGWDTRFNLEWIEDCPLPKGEVFMKLGEMAV